MKMHIVMVTKNRERLFEQSIRSLYAHTRGFELHVVDDCSQNIDTLKRLRAIYGFNVHFNEHPTPLGGSRNQILQYLPDGMVYISDDDVYFTENWLSKLWHGWVNKPEEVKILAGGCHKYLGTNHVVHHNGWELHYKDAISGWSWLMERKTWVEFGPYDANALGVGQSEDWAFCQRVKQAGFQVASIWPEVVIHCGRTNAEGRPATGSETIVDVPGVLVE